MSLPSQIAAILFDFDGTLVHQRIDFELMRAQVIEIARQFAAPEGMLGGRYMLELIAGVIPVLGSQGPAFARAAHQAITAIEVAAADTAEPFEGTADLLCELHRRGYRLAIITRNCRAAVERVLAAHPLIYDALLTRDDVPEVKPEPMHLLAALEALGATVHQALVVGDHPLDVLGGKRIGAATVGVRLAGEPADYFDQAAPDLVLEHITALAAHLSANAPHITPRRVLVEAKKRLYDGFFKLEEASVRYERFDGSLSTSHQRLLFERGDAVAVLPYDPQTRRVVLVCQFRYPVAACGGSAWLWEAIAGIVDGDRTPEEVARAEALEEAGYAIGALEHIMTVYPSPGACSERVHLYLAPLTPGMRVASGGGLAEGHEDILVRLYTLEEAMRLVENGGITDAKTILALQHLAIHSARYFSEEL
ncbi:MAG: HAD-IA family hydrolase [Anaerolineae bacterium]